MIFTDNTMPTDWTTGTITTITDNGWYEVIRAKEIPMAETRFRFPETFIPTITEPTMLVGGKNIRDIDVADLKTLIVAIELVSVPYKARWKEDFLIGNKPADEVVKLIEKDIQRRIDEALDSEIEAAQRLVIAYETQEMKLKKAQEALDAARAKKEARAK